MLLASPVILVGLAGCSNGDLHAVDFGPKTIQPASDVLEACDASARQATADVQAMYAREDVVYSEIDADGSRTDEETARLMAMLEQGELDLRAAVEPTMTQCSSIAEWVAAAMEYPTFVGYTTADAVADDTIQYTCRYFLTSPVCLDAAKHGIDMLPAP